MLELTLFVPFRAEPERTPWTIYFKKYFVHTTDNNLLLMADDNNRYS